MPLDIQAAELRRIERDLHDGAQARLVSLGLQLGAVDRKMTQDPEEARRLLRQARTSSVQALRELRDLVHGIHPPVPRRTGPARRPARPSAWPARCTSPWSWTCRHGCPTRSSPPSTSPCPSCSPTP
ncbi:histidine kinase dimerization/phosphoacceptor domain-containing protein [Streptomyces tricolor]|nr:histidine kinase dimerization/phosphoacceptor domain-containing protein [Streptomyces tricolor]